MDIHDLRWVCATVVALCNLNAAMAAPEPGSLESLTLKISVEQKDLLPMEPVQVAISLANETDKPVLARTLFISSAGGPPQVFFSTGDGPFQKISPADWPDKNVIIPPGGEQFAPGWKKTLTAILYCVRTGDAEKVDVGWRYLLPSPGTCRIKATLKDVDGKQQIESNVLTIKAREPVGEDARAYAFLKDLEGRKDKDAQGRRITYSGFLTSLGSPEQEAKQEEFLSKFPNSRYARHLYYSLGHMYSWGKGNGGIRRGLEYLEKAGGYKDFFLAPKALGYLVEACVKQGDLKKARQHLATLQEKFPDTESARVAAHHVQQASN